jgi:deoxyribonuclease V
MNFDVSSEPKFSVSKAHRAQLYLSRKIITEDRLPERIKLVGGVDVAYTDKMAIGAAVVLNFESLELLEQQIAITKIRLPYVPTLLAFREMPPTTACIKKLRLQPDVFLVNGQGIAHPYECGFASHLGLAIGKPTIGVAKNKLIGDYSTTTSQVFRFKEKRVIEAVATAKARAKPIYVSVGHLISLETALKITKKCLCDNRLPEPILFAHKIASEEKNKRQFANK